MIKASVILAVAFCAAGLFRRRSAAERHIFWTAAIGSAALLPLLAPFLPPWQPELVGRVASVLPAISQTAAPQVSAYGTEVVVHAEGIEPARSLANLLLGTWFAGAVIAILILIAAVFRLRSVAAGARCVTDARWTTMAVDLSRSLGLKRTVRILESDQASMPVTWGFFRPQVLLPASAADWSDERLRVVLAHELAHVYRFDWLVQFLAEIVRAVYWFNPLFWIASSRLHRESEQACDDAVVTLGVDGRDYATHLLELARSLRVSDRRWVPALAMARRPDLERRVVAIVDFTLSRRAVTRRRMIAVMISAFCLAVPLAAMRAPARQAAPAIRRARIGELPVASETPGSVQTPPEVAVYNAPPLYSDEARRRGIEGTVTAEVQVDASGRVSGLRVVRGLGFGLDQNALLAVRDWQFRPGTRNGSPVEMTTHVGVEFDLRNEELNELIANDMAHRVGLDVSPPRIIYRVEPQYSDSAKSEQITGAVVLDLMVREDGVPNVLRVVRSLRSDLDENAINALEQWRLSPAMKDGMPVKVRVNVEVHFNLR
ncbi:MAG TPA: M56 family metallopeptidase [Terriglobia bacterium]|nr:M56 family metallopeptidase [Terriglobia bacterium]